VFQGLRTVNYHVGDLARAKAWYSALLSSEPYFDEPFYVGYNVGGYELGLNPDTATFAPGEGGTITYWGVENADTALARLVELGATVREQVQDVGEGIRLAVVTDPFGNLVGIIENPHFSLENAR
jgi:predicted enzyme related to lactoylglutathione lyase